MTPEELEAIPAIEPDIVEKILVSVNSYYSQFETPAETEEISAESGEASTPEANEPRASASVTREGDEPRASASVMREGDEPRASASVTRETGEPAAEEPVETAETASVEAASEPAEP